MAFASDFRQSKQDAVAAQKVAYVCAGIVICVLCGATTLGMMIWQETVNATATAASRSAMTVAREAATQQKGRSGLTPYERCLAAKRLGNRMTNAALSVYGRGREADEGTAMILEQGALDECERFAKKSGK